MGAVGTTGQTKKVCEVGQAPAGERDMVGAQRRNGNNEGDSQVEGTE